MGMAEETRMGASAEHGAPSAGESASSGRTEVFAEEKRHRSRSRSGRVEKRIEASLAEAEPAATARSRKSSHMLQLFKENTSTEGKMTQEKSWKASRSTSNGYLPNEAGLDDTQGNTEDGQNSVTRGDLVDDGATTDTPRTSPGGKENDGAMDRKAGRSGTREAAIQIPAATSDGLEPSAQASSEIVLDSGIPGSSRSERRNGSPKSSLPSRLLEEIRGYHNLGAPVNARFKKSHFSDQQRNADQQYSEVGAIGRKTALEGRTIATTIAVDEPSEEAEEELDEDSSDKELISSALYYPHTTASPDTLEGVCLEQVRSVKDLDQVHRFPYTGPLSPTIDVNDESEDVDIALESQKQNRYLHGALPKDLAPSDEFTPAPGLDTGASSASESEYSSLTDDGDTTPRATPSAAKGALLRSKHRKGRRPRAKPLQAVELKPFKHQVGGHSTIFRFSKKAVCKQLSNKENEFYEIVEHSHPELLRFMPR